MIAVIMSTYSKSKEVDNQSRRVGCVKVFDVRCMSFSRQVKSEYQCPSGKSIPSAGPSLIYVNGLLVFVERRFLMAKRRYPPKIEGKEKILKNIYMFNHKII